MEYLTIEEVQTAANDSEKAAIISTITHWKQITTASRDDLSKCPMGSAYCALCVRSNGDCSTCILGTCLKPGSNYNEVRWAYGELRTDVITIDEFHELCKPMLEEIRKLL